jgi:hypothetical protein
LSKITNFYRLIRYNLLDRKYSGISAPFRVLPNFLVIGVGRGGTTSLFEYLGQHNCITKSAYDEIGYFDDNFHLGLNWYRSMFPTTYHKKKIIKKYGDFLTFEVTPWYIRKPWLAKRIQNTLKNIKIITVLRNPIDRTYSHYHLALRDNKITKSFDEIIDEDMDTLKKSFSRNKDKDYFNNVVQNSFLARSFYAEQLEQWFKIFNKKNMLIVSSENLSKNTQDTLNTIFSFLNLNHQEIPNLEKINVGKYSPISNSIHKKLFDYFYDYNETLFNLIEHRYNWND